MGLLDFIKEIINNQKRRFQKELDLNLLENKDLLEDPQLLSKVVKENLYLKNIKVPPVLSQETKQILQEDAPDKDYTYKTEKFTEYTVGYDKVYKVEKKVTDFKQFQEADKIYERIVETINPEWDDISKFKYLYNELAMRISYDYSAVSRFNDEIDNMYKADNNASNIFSALLTQKGICLGIAEAYEYLCKKANLDCDIEINIPKKHAYNIITYKNNNGEIQKSYCDLTWDLQLIKRGQPCKNFAKSSKEFAENHQKIKCYNFIGIDDLEQSRIDTEIGYTPRDGEYKINEYIDKIKALKDIEGNENKINIALNQITDLGDLTHMSDFEVISFAKLLLDNLESPQVGISVLCTRNKEDIKDTKGVLWVRDFEENSKKNKYSYYVFNSNQQQFKSLDKEVIEELMASGMLEFYFNTKLPGFEEWETEKQMQQRMRNKGLVR